VTARVGRTLLSAPCCRYVPDSAGCFHPSKEIKKQSIASPRPTFPLTLFSNIAKL